MKETLSYVLVTPYTISKSRTGGVLSRLLFQSGLDLCGAQIFAPDAAFTKEYAKQLKAGVEPQEVSFLAEYVETNFAPSRGRPHRVLLLVFRGIDPCEKLKAVCGRLYPEHREAETEHGETIRDTYADLIVSPAAPNKYIYFEPAVITPRTQDEADAALVFFASWLNGKANLVHNMVYTDPEKIEQTLVIIKPENWLHASSRPGAIIDMFSRTGLRIIGIKVHRFSLSGAIEFYGAVENALIGKLAPVFGDKAFELLEEEFNIILTPETKRALADSFGRDYARNQYFQILEFMSGKRPDMCPKTEWDSFSDVKCMVVIYEGENAVQKIRNILGPTDPTKAPPGTIRREFGSNVMVNSAHASDSVESYLREKTIVQVEENTLCKIITEYLKNRD